jgi:hypothetical protein
MKIILKNFIFSIALFSSQVALANWSWGIGYHNPPSSTLGVNFMHLWSNWAFEAGLGYLGSSESSNKNTGTNNTGTTTQSQFFAGGDVNLKYLFSSGFFRPFLQIGSGTSISLGNTSNNDNNSNNTGAKAALNGNFAGAGFMLMGSEFYFYVSYLTSNNGSAQIGVGFN